MFVSNTRTQIRTTDVKHCTSNELNTAEVIIVRLLGNSIVDQRYIEHGMANNLYFRKGNRDNVDSTRLDG